LPPAGVATAAPPAGEIAVIDLAPFLTGGDPAPVVRRIAEVYPLVSFLQVIGHGIAPETFDAVYRANDALLALPRTKRDALSSPDGHPWRGLVTMRAVDGTPTVHRFQVSRYDDPAAALAAGIPAEYGDFFARNVWPEQVAGLRTAVTTCLDEMTRVGDALMELFARALGLPADYFAPMLTHPTTDLAVNSYPAQPDQDPAAEPPVTFWEHSDSGMLTVLHQRGDYAGLQVRDLDDSWITVPVSPDTLVINIDDLMARWTNDRWPSTRHRVVAAPDTTSTRDSIAAFHLPNVDTVIAPLEPFIGADGPHYEPVTPYVWEAMFLAKYDRRVPS
jgi:isopenicillin N synthase-like dioxygenase